MSYYEIFVLNYNGAHFLTDCLTSLKRLSTNGHHVVVNVIDNGSSDQSMSIVKKFADFNFISLRENLGFSLGNNRGVNIRLKQLTAENKKPDYLIFLNNDTKVDQNMLKAIDQTFMQDQKVGIVGVRSLFMDDFIPLSLDSKLSDNQFLDISLEGENLGQAQRMYRAYKGCYLGKNTWRLNHDGCIFIPVSDSTKTARVTYSCSKHRPEFSLLRTFYRKDNLFYKEHAVNITDSSFEVEPKQFVKLIQNAGSFVTSRLEAGDMGSFEIDSGQYSEDRELNAVCGVAMTVRRDLFVDLGGFDEHYFAYYEDTDLSLRARRKGYKCFYSGQALIQHVHAGSSGVGTDYFRFNVTYSRLYFLSKFASPALYRQRLLELKHRFKNEFDLYLHDGFVENKPNLKSYAKYFRYFLKFYANRIARIFYIRQDKNIKESFFSEKYVNEY